MNYDASWQIPHDLKQTCFTDKGKFYLGHYERSLTVITINPPNRILELYLTTKRNLKVSSCFREYTLVSCDSQTTFFSAFWRHKDTCTPWLPLSTACWYILLNLTMMTAILFVQGKSYFFTWLLLTWLLLHKQQQNLFTNNNYISFVLNWSIVFTNDKDSQYNHAISSSTVSISPSLH